MHVNFICQTLGSALHHEGHIRVLISGVLSWHRDELHNDNAAFFELCRLMLADACRPAHLAHCRWSSCHCLGRHQLPVKSHPAWAGMGPSSPPGRLSALIAAPASVWSAWPRPWEQQAAPASVSSAWPLPLVPAQPPHMRIPALVQRLWQLQLARKCKEHG